MPSLGAPLTPLVTPRLALTPFQASESAALFEIRGDRTAMAYWDWPGDRSLAETQDCAMAMIGEIERGEACHWTIRRRTDRDFIGVCDLSAGVEPTRAEIGFMLPRRHWRQGYAAEAVAALVEQAALAGLTGLDARIHSANEASARLFERQRFSLSAGPADHEIRPGVFVPCSWYERVLPSVV
jgi:[ribosomal protein S5]-alanine N-acetyltransferase